ncbi:sigma-70 family RNA polymerase sigma factor [Paenibacillus sp. HJL G12]|uniref:Sigma-70 family RNA polymerase sigma factor n=1 Tax=Paenibacillus dendrobii TaxID=2691084 RepID=A0A7X3IG71_9BACL|nr:RNA polymerase sigma factor [Paenibacillus dendrobii]MWV43347.1 sigma-70 family RNA polymerase sigma factor [Paenibacillus dendrobii]
MESTEEYVSRVKAGDGESFRPIVEIYQQQIYVYCCRMLGCKQDAQDAVQDILFKAYTKLDLYESRATFSSWLYKIAYHHCLNMLRKRHIRDRVYRLFKPATFTESAEQNLDRQWFSPPLEYALSRLSVEERSILILRVFEEEPFAEIADILGKSTDAVKKKYTRLKQKVIRLIAEKEGEKGCNTKESLVKMKL